MRLYLLRCTRGGRHLWRGWRFALALLMVLTVGAATPTGSPPPAFAARPVAAPAAPLPRYSVAATLDIDAATAAVDQSLQFVNQTGQPLESVVFRAMAGALGALTLDEASVDGQLASVSVDPSGSILEVPLPAPLLPGAEVTVRLLWQLAIPRGPGRLSADGQVVSLGNWLPLLAVFREGWDRRPYTDVGDAFFSEAADFDVTLDLSRPAVVAATGDARQATDTRWLVSARGVRDFALAVSPSFTMVEAPLGVGPTPDTLIRVYTPNAGRAPLYLQAAREFAAAFGDLLGAYPYSQFSVAETPLPTSYAGMEYPQLVFLAPGLSAADFPRSPAREVLAHEVAHQWFYGLIGNDQLADPWLDEAMTTQLTAQGYEQVSPALAPSVAGNPPAAVRVDRGVFDFSSDPPYFNAIYGGGARFVMDLRSAMGEEAWGSFLRELYATYRGKVATPRAVVDLAARLAPDPSAVATVVQGATSYGVPPGPWTLDAPPEAWQGWTSLTVTTTFPTTRVELWLDGRLLVRAASSGTYAIDAGQLPAGAYVLLARVTDTEGQRFERAVRVAVAA